MSSIRIQSGNCPQCRKSVQVPLDQRGQWLTCPYCNQTVQFGVSNSSETIGFNNSLTVKQIIILLVVGLGTIVYLVRYHPLLKSPTQQVGGSWKKFWTAPKAEQPVSEISAPTAL